MDELWSRLELFLSRDVIERRYAYHHAVPDGWHLNELCALAAGSHVMSMLVRYYPTRWARLLAHEPGDSLLPVLQRLRG